MPETHRNALRTGHHLHEYRVERILGAGGFGVTYLAYDESLQQPVVIKEYMPNDLAVREGITVHPKSSGDEETFRWGLDRFIQEARNLARFRHPNIVQILRFFEANNTAYMIMPFEDGDSLKNILARRKSRLDEETLQAILFPLLDGLEEVHRAGMIHRDIAPDNIYIRRKDESPVLLDFGAARQAVGGKSKGLSVVVKDGYAPAEQYETHGNQGPWTDIYALAAVMYRAIAGETPPQATARMNAFARGKADPLRPVTEVGWGHYSEPFLQAVDHALAKVETDRPQSARAWREEFMGKSREPPPPPPFLQSSPSRPRKKLAIGLGLLVLLGIGIWMGIGTPKKIVMEFVSVPGGTFEMGCGSWQSDCSDNEKPVQTVTVGSFEIGKYDVTQGQWRTVMGSNPSNFTSCGDNCPVEQVSWDDVQKFIQKMNARGQGKYRLPTEAEWEYACRSGGRPEKYCGGNDIGRLAWYTGNSGNKTHPVGQKAANGLGIYDMSGNVWEWTCSDWGKYDDGGKNHAKCSGGGSLRVDRGGSWDVNPARVRSASRNYYGPGNRNFILGFRLARTSS
ncbi:MAG: SUMF1/EgtB/PvdO family nonheme iron enzyme [Magnetococcales bacterium]|nr:SUMF1/EgtB/PvdO family nonheme iron enzyme [Magnetococcales bacterium]